jgi:hypothetical protein
MDNAGEHFRFVGLPILLIEASQNVSSRNPEHETRDLDWREDGLRCRFWSPLDDKGQGFARNWLVRASTESINVHLGHCSTEKRETKSIPLNALGKSWYRDFETSISRRDTFPQNPGFLESSRIQ